MARHGGVFLDGCKVKRLLFGGFNATYTSALRREGRVVRQAARYPLTLVSYTLREKLVRRVNHTINVFVAIFLRLGGNGAACVSRPAVEVRWC